VSRPRQLTLAVLHAVLIGGTGHAGAQSSACDQLKGTLSARIEASGVHDYALEAVPVATPTPANARVIGTCDGGRTKMLYRRGVGTQQLPEAPTAARQDPAPQASAASRSRAAKAAKTEVVADDRAPAPVPAPMPDPTPAPAPAAAPAVVPAAMTPALMPAPASQSVTLASEIAAPTPPAKDSIPVAPPAKTSSLLQQATELAAGYWHYLLALVLVPIAAWLWSWVTYRRAYDKAGLPRGPRL
jgi:hypothetical protein